VPIAPTYPGVYIEEIPSGVRTITGVATAITAFIGRARRGPADDPTAVYSFSDFERQFGGLWADSTMSYAVRSFFLNGGGEGLIVRVANGAVAAEIVLGTGVVGDDQTLDASSPGAWGNNLNALVDYDTKDPTDTDLFNLTVAEAGGATEKHLNVSANAADVRYLPRVLDEESSLVRVPKDGTGVWIVAAGRPAENGPAGTDATPSSGDDGGDLTDTELTGLSATKTGIYALEKADLFNLLSIPPSTRETGSTPDTSGAVYQEALAYCVKRRAVLLVDPGKAWTATSAKADVAGLGLVGTDARNAAVYFPRLRAADPALESKLDNFVPSGSIAGIIARTDAQRGFWKAPAGVDATVNGVAGVTVSLTEGEIGALNPLGVNCIRSLPVFGTIVWGARTVRGADQLADEYKYIPVRRTALYIEESLYRGTQWVVFEPNDEPLWAQIRLNVGAFMQNLFRQGAFQGSTPRDAYFVKCDKETTTQNDINLGIVNILVGFAPLKPAEFVIIKIQQIAGQVQA
jgi:phage tail sheath protein FI